MIKGSIVALATPMHANGEIDLQSLDSLVEWHISKGTGGIVAVGTTGESATLSSEEHCEVIAAIIRKSDGRIPVIAGTGSNSTLEAIELTREAEALGADAALLVTPYYNRPTQAGLIRHYEAIAAAVTLPQILYNVPGRTGCDMSNETVAALVDRLPGIIGIKDATGSLERGADLIRRVGDRVAVYSGDDASAFELMLMGGKGNISVTANVLPEKMARLCQLSMDGNREEATRLQEELMPLHDALFCESSPIPVKWVMHAMGLIPDGIRLPLTWLSADSEPQLRDAMAKTGIVNPGTN